MTAFGSTGTTHIAMLRLFHLHAYICINTHMTEHAMNPLTGQKRKVLHPDASLAKVLLLAGSAPRLTLTGHNGNRAAGLFEGERAPLDAP